MRPPQNVAEGGRFVTTGNGRHTVSSITGWRQHYRSHPYTTLALALGCGLLVAGGLSRVRLTGRRLHRSDRFPARARAGRASSGLHRLLDSTSGQSRPLRNWIDLALAAYRVGDSLYRALPVFRRR